LYADMSERMMRLIREVAGSENQEVYSIDECFVRLGSEEKTLLEKWGKRLREKIGRGLGLPVTVGIAPTKTLAKLVAGLVKRDPLSGGVWCMTMTEWQLVAGMPVSEVWGVGQSLARQLMSGGIETVGKLVAQPQAWVRQKLGLAGERTWRELRGESCVELLEARVAHRQILRSRTFGEAVVEKDELWRAVAELTTIAVESLRRHCWRAGLVTVFVRTGWGAEGKERYGESATMSLLESTSYAPELMTMARRALERVYQAGYRYKRAGVVLAGLESEKAWQPALGSEWEMAEEKKQKVMQAVERANKWCGGRKVVLGVMADGERGKWRPKMSLRSSGYTTEWEELRVVS
jgi:DNA polymerase V